jgi:hypothetical protein
MARLASFEQVDHIDNLLHKGRRLNLQTAWQAAARSALLWRKLSQPAMRAASCVGWQERSLVYGEWPKRPLS